MAGDRSGYRSFYPGITRYAQSDWEREIWMTLDPQKADFLRNLAEDSLRVRVHVTSLPWPNHEFLQKLKELTAMVCKAMIETILEMSQGGLSSSV
jgi:hypothetical protein